MYCATAGRVLSFSVFRDDFNTSVLRFVEFMRQRQVDGKVIAKHVLAIERLLIWLRASATPAYSAYQEMRHNEQITIMTRLKYQLGMTSNPQPINSVELRQQGKWLDAPELLALIERISQTAIDLVKVTMPLHLSCCSILPCLIPVHCLGMCRSLLPRWGLPQPPLPPVDGGCSSPSFASLKHTLITQL